MDHVLFICGAYIWIIEFIFQGFLRHVLGLSCSIQIQYLWLHFTLLSQLNMDIFEVNDYFTKILG